MQITIAIEIVLYKINLKKLHQKDFLQWILRLRLWAPRRMTDAVFEYDIISLNSTLECNLTSGQKREPMKKQHLSALEEREALMRTYS